MFSKTGVFSSLEQGYFLAWSDQTKSWAPNSKPLAESDGHEEVLVVRVSSDCTSSSAGPAGYLADEKLGLVKGSPVRREQCSFHYGGHQRGHHVFVVRLSSGGTSSSAGPAG